MKKEHWIIVGLVLLVIWQFTCQKEKSDQDPPAVTSSDTYRKEILLDSVALKRATDSIRKSEVTPALAAAKYWYDQYVSANTHSAQQADILTDFINKDCPDSSGRVKAELGKLLSLHAQTVNACDSTIKQKDLAFAGQLKITATTEKSLEDNRSDFRRALRTQDTLQAYIDQVRPRRSISLGITGSTSDQFNGIGPAIGYRDTKGNQFDYSMQFLNGFKTKQHTLTVKKTLFNF